MESIYIALITVTGSIVVASASFFLNENAKRKRELQQKKFEHYDLLFKSISALVTQKISKKEADEQFSQAVNTIALVASQEVITSIINFHDYIGPSNTDSKSDKQHDELLVRLVLAVRKDIGISKKDNDESFVFHLFGSR